jgi:hypothetical protein
VTLSELVEQWRKREADNNVLSDGLHEAANELEDYVQPALRGGGPVNTEPVTYRPYTPEDFMETWTAAYLRQMAVQRPDGLVALYAFDLCKN